MELTDVRIRAAKSLSWVRRVVVVSAVVVSLPMGNALGSETRHSRNWKWSAGVGFAGSDGGRAIRPGTNEPGGKQRHSASGDS
jgi:hypothetical protein